MQYRERGADVDRAVNSGTLDVGLKPGMSAIDDAKFAQAVKFEEGKMAAQAAAAHYDIDKGTLALSGKEPGMLAPHVVTEQITVDAVTIDVTLAGPKLKAVGQRPERAEAGVEQAGRRPTNDVKMPAMLKQDQPVLVVGENMDYDGAISKATYTGGARLWQGDTSIKGESIVIDNKSGATSARQRRSTTVLDHGARDRRQGQEEGSVERPLDRRPPRTSSTRTPRGG